MHERWKPSVTVAAVIERDGRFLLVEEHTSDGLRLNNPAGHLEPGESPQEGVCREVLEETARSFTPRAVVGVYLAHYCRGGEDPGVTYLRFTYSGDVGEPDEARALDHGIVRTLWLTLDELRAQPERLRGPLVLRGIEDHLAGRHHALSVVQTDASVHQLARRPPATP
jgi:8-oxo-dGTP pyrophosphatase MutT (NUDIX family)